LQIQYTHTHHKQTEISEQRTKNKEQRRRINQRRDAASIKGRNAATPQRHNATTPQRHNAAAVQRHDSETAKQRRTHSQSPTVIRRCQSTHSLTQALRLV